MKEEGDSLPIASISPISPLTEPLKGRVAIRSKPKLSYEEEKRILNPKSNFPRPPIYEGYYEDETKVAIQEVKIQGKRTRMEIKREFQILRKLENHENFIRYFCYEENVFSTILYIATELCTCSIADLYDPNEMEKSILKSKEIMQTLKPKTILFQATRGLEYLHSYGYVHRNVKPSSFLIKELVAPNKSCSHQYVIKITDFRLSRKVEDGGENSGTVASDNWEAPESKPGQPLKPSLDVYLLGRLFYFVIAAHEFRNGRGADWNKPLPAQIRSIFDIAKLPITDEIAKSLIKSMSNEEESKRPALYKVLEDPYFQISKEFYRMYEDYKKPGLCIIFNQENFNMSDGSKHQRVGTQIDCQRLKETFGGLGYDVEELQDLTSYGLKFKVEELARREDLTDYGSLVVCLLSHGSEGHILCTDDVLVNINSIRTVFSLENCPGLCGKPKIFIVQACRTPQQTPLISEWRKLFIKTLSGLRNVLHYQPFEEEEEENHAPRKITEGPSLMDFLTIYATLPEVVAYRFEDKGSPFIQALCDGLRDEYLSDKEDDSSGKQDLEFVLRGDRGVQGLMNCRKKWQTMEWESCLYKYICFQKRQPEALSTPSQGVVNQTSIAIDTPPVSSNTRVQLALAVFFVFVSYLIFTACCD